jgi:hypothetical protein
LYKEKHDFGLAMQCLHRVKEVANQGLVCRLKGDIYEDQRKQDLAMCEYRKGYSYGDVLSTYYLGKYEFSQGRYAQAKDLLIQSSRSMHGLSCDYLAQVYEKENKFDQAFAMYKRAANLGVARAQFILVGYYRRVLAVRSVGRLGKRRRLQLAFEWCRRAAAADYEDAFFPLAQMYRYGYGVKKNTQQFLKWSFKAAAVDDREAKGSFQQSGILKDKAAKIVLDQWMMFLHPYGRDYIFWLAVMLQNGYFTSKDFTVATKCYYCASDMNHQNALKWSRDFKSMFYDNLRVSRQFSLESPPIFKNIVRDSIRLGNLDAFNKWAYRYFHELIDSGLIVMDRLPSPFQKDVAKCVEQMNGCAGNKPLVPPLFQLDELQKLMRSMCKLSYCLVEKKYSLERVEDAFHCLLNTVSRSIVNTKESGMDKCNRARVVQMLSYRRTFELMKRFSEFIFEHKRIAQSKKRVLCDIDNIQLRRTGMRMRDDLLKFQLKKNQKKFFYKRLKKLKLSSRLDLSYKYINQVQSAFENKRLAWMVKEAYRWNELRQGRYVPYYEENGRLTPHQYPPDDQYQGPFDPVSILLYQGAAIELFRDAIKALGMAYTDSKARRATREELAVLTYQAIAIKDYETLCSVAVLYQKGDFNIRPNHDLVNELYLMMANKKDKDSYYVHACIHLSKLAYALREKDSKYIQVSYQWLMKAKEVRNARALVYLDCLFTKACSHYWPQDKDFSHQLIAKSKTCFPQALQFFYAKEKKAVLRVRNKPGLFGEHFFSLSNNSNPRESDSLSVRAVGGDKGNQQSAVFFAAHSEHKKVCVAKEGTTVEGKVPRFSSVMKSEVVLKARPSGFSAFS